MDEYEVYLMHHGTKGMKWGVRKKQAPPPTTMERVMDSKAVELAKGTPGGNAASLAVTAASIAAVASSAPISVPIIVGGSVSARLAIKSYEAYKLFYEKRAPKLRTKAKPDSMARLKVGQDMRKQLTEVHGSKKMSELAKR